jgi:hypothetical protein
MPVTIAASRARAPERDRAQPSSPR